VLGATPGGSGLAQGQTRLLRATPGGLRAASGLLRMAPGTSGCAQGGSGPETEVDFGEVVFRRIAEVGVATGKPPRLGISIRIW
jgi:hypothetical protein